MSSAFLVLVTWPDGREGLLFPRPGNVAMASDITQGRKDFATALAHLMEYVEDKPEIKGTTIRLVRFERMETALEFTL